MHTSEIRKNCLKCGNHTVQVVEGSQFSTDYCKAAAQECSNILWCDESMRKPKKKANDV